MAGNLEHEKVGRRASLIPRKALGQFVDRKTQVLTACTSVLREVAQVQTTPWLEFPG